MLKPLRAVARQFDKRIGWNRVGVALSITIIAVAAIVLYRMLHDIDVREVMRAARRTPLRDLFLAGLFVAAGYFTLTFYDLFALRTIGWNTIPYRVAALAGFTSYSIGHNVGASVFTGAAARHRRHFVGGLSAVAVAKSLLRSRPALLAGQAAG